MPVLGFALCATFVLYVLIGYPAALAVWAKLFPQSIRKEFVPRSVSVVLPVKNGADWITSKLDSLLSSDYPAQLLNILVISDGSSDRTATLVARYGNPAVELVQLAPGGKAKAVTEGLARATGEIVVLTDVRQIFDAQAIRLMVSCFADEAVGVVTGELMIRQGNSKEEYNTGLYWKYEKWIRRNLNQLDRMLGATGSIYAIRRSLAAAIPAQTLLDDVYLPLKIAMRGHRIYFEERARAYDLPTSLKSEFRRKVRTQAGVYQILMAFPSLLSPLNPRFLHFFSHKLGRLMLPYAMAATFVFTFFLPDPARMALLAAQALFYGLALIDPVVGERNPLKKLSAVIRAFVVLVAAAACALKVFFLPAQDLWKETKVGASKGQ